MRLLLEKGANRELTIVYKKPEFPYFSRGLPDDTVELYMLSMLDATFELGDPGSPPLLLARKGAITTTLEYNQEKRATIRELARTSGNDEIAAQF